MPLKFATSAARLLSLLLVANCAPTSEPARPPQASAPPAPATSATATAPSTGGAYDELVKRLRAGDRAVDFTELRVAYTESAAYRKNALERDKLSGLRSAMREAVAKHDSAALVPICNAIVDRVFVDLDAHKYLKHAHTDLGHPAEADFHRFVELGLLKSIIGGNDGKSAATAWRVVTVDEEYFVLRMIGAKPAQQHLKSIDGHHYDVMDTVDGATKSSVTYYFNIDVHLRALNDLLEPSTGAP
jgi:hypothetical protein